MATSPAIKSVARPLLGVAKAITPTGVGVLLSIGAHVLFFVAGPRPNFSFAALNEAAQQEAEETVVPLIELTPAEQSRLPSFAQPRRTPPSATSLGNSFPLPPSIGTLNRRSQSSGTNKPNLAGRLPSPTTTTTIRPNAGRSVLGGTGFGGLGNRAPTRRPTSRPSANPVIVDIPQSSGVRLPVLEPGVTVTEQTITPGNATGTTEQPTDNNDTNNQTPVTPQNPLDQQLARAQAEANNNATPNTPESSGTETTPGTEEETATPIQVEQSEAIAIAPAQGNPNQLRDAYRYDPTDVDDDAAQTNLDTWLSESAEDKSGLESQTVGLTIDSNFKACVDVPPASGLIGVIVNPDGSQESNQVLKSIGYDLLNREALDAVTYYDFGPPAVPTQYQVNIEVLYDPQNCVGALPETN